MKKCIFILLIFIMIDFGCIAQKSESIAGASIKMYLIEWDLKTKFPYTSEEFMNHYRYMFEAKFAYNDSLFIDGTTCEKTLISQPSLSDSLISKRKHVVSRVIVTYSKKEKYELFFDRNGNYLYNGKWYLKNDYLYDYVFKYFSSDLIKYPAETNSEL